MRCFPVRFVFFAGEALDFFALPAQLVDLQRPTGVLTPFPGPGGIALDLLELLAGGDPLRAFLAQQVERQGQLVPLFIPDRIDGVPRQRVFTVLLAGFEMAQPVRQDDVGDDPAVLGRVAADPVEFLDRHLQRAERFVLIHVAEWQAAVEIDDRLHRPLAVGMVATDDDRPPVVLQDPGEDFRG